MGLFGIFEHIMGSKLGKRIGQGEAAGYGAFQSGLGIEDQAIGGLNKDITGYQGMIDEGGLTPALRAQMNVARARVLDQGSQQRGALRTNLAQTALQTPGGLSPAAQAELQSGGNENIGASEFGATQDINSQEARLGFESTSRLLDRINQARTAILGAGASRASLGSGMFLGSMNLDYARNKAISDATQKWASMGAGGGGGF